MKFCATVGVSLSLCSATENALTALPPNAMAPVARSPTPGSVGQTACLWSRLVKAVVIQVCPYWLYCITSIASIASTASIASNASTGGTGSIASTASIDISESI
jgi:hypothetical protein